ncbi:MAG: hypothetical protein ACRD2L_19795 [Terriglobia bacterium]
MSEDIEVKAKELGWMPKDEFRGDPAQWVDAKSYVERGETMLPLIKANNRRLTTEVTALRQELNAAKETLKASQESIEALKEFNSDANRKAMKRQIAVTKASLIQAKKDNDVEAEVELTTQLQDESLALRDAEGKPDEPPAKTVGKTGSTNGGDDADFTKSSEWKAWTVDNPWFGTDKRRTALAMGIADELRNDPATSKLRGRPYLDRVTEEVEKVFSPAASSGKSKVEHSGSRGAGGGGSGGKSYADLPQDAREICERQAGRLVGDGRAYKTKEEWRAAYAETYYAEE